MHENKIEYDRVVCYNNKDVNACNKHFIKKQMSPHFIKITSLRNKWTLVTKTHKRKASVELVNTSTIFDPKDCNILDVLNHQNKKASPSPIEILNADMCINNRLVDKCKLSKAKTCASSNCQNQSM